MNLTVFMNHPIRGKLKHWLILGNVNSNMFHLPKNRNQISYTENKSEGSGGPECGVHFVFDNVRLQSLDPGSSGPLPLFLLGLVILWLLRHD